MDECEPVIVEGDWGQTQAKTLRNKLQLYFQSKKKSSGGDCRVEAEDGAPRAAVFFRSEEVRERVLARDDHEIIVENQTIKLRLTSGDSLTNNNNEVPDSSTDSKEAEVEPGNDASAANKEGSKSAPGAIVVLENINNTSRDLLLMLVENISGQDESCWRLEIIWESNKAVVTFNEAADAEKFLTVSQTSKKLQKYEVSARPLDAATSVRVENLPPTVVKDMLELYFEKTWTEPDSVLMIPEEQAAIITFSDPKVVESICIKEDYDMRSIPIKVYPYYESLATALYGNERPTWKMPEPFTENVYPIIWKFLQEKKLCKSINDQMRPHFCRVDLKEPQVTLSPMPSFLRQQSLTEKDIDNWMGKTQHAFRHVMTQYSAFECPVNAPAWKAAEKDVHSVVMEDAILVVDESKGVVTIAGQADDIKRIKAPVENIILKAMVHIDRQTNAISEQMQLSPALFYILKQDGLQKVALDISPEMTLSYDESTQKLTIAGLPTEVFKMKSWILERNVNMSKKHLYIPPSLLDFLRSVDPMDMSQDLFTSQGISVIYSVDSKGVFLLGSSDKILADAESKMKAVLSVNTLDVEDQEVMKLQGWVDLNQQLLDTYNSSKKKTVAVQFHPERRDKITVSGFTNPVKEVSCSLREFIMNYSTIEEKLRVESCAVVQFIDRKKTHDWSSIAKANDVKVLFDPERPRIFITGARLHVHKAKSSFQQLVSTLCTDTLTVDKPGAKKYFQSQGSLFLSTIMSEFSCVVTLGSDFEDEEEEEENYGEENSLCYCRVQTSGGIRVSVSKADICSFNVDAVVNAANEDLQHIGGLALALLKAAGPQLQNTSNDYITKNGKLRPGDAIVTDAYNLPCKYVVHAVGPRFSDSDTKTSVSRLKTAVKESLKQAEMHSCSTIALPAISSGVFGFPVDLCTETIAQAVREYCDSPQRPTLTEIYLVDNVDKTVRVLAAAVNSVFNDLGPTMTVPQQGGKVTGATGRNRGRGRGRGKSRGQYRAQSTSPLGHQFTGGGAWAGGRGERGGRGGRGGGERGRRGAGSWEYNQGNRGGYSSKDSNQAGRHRGWGEMEKTTAEGLKIVLCKGNIQDQTTDVIVNTISDDMNLKQGAVSKALLEEAGHSLQSAVLSEARVTTLPYGYVVITDGFRLKCQKVFHAVCPPWDHGDGQAEEELVFIIRYCLKEAERLQMVSISFPAIGTGNLSFPRDVVSRVLVKEVHLYSRMRTPLYLREVAVVVHPTDSQTMDSFIRELSGGSAARNVQQEEFNRSPPRQPLKPITASQSKSSSASFSPVLSPSLGVYRMQMGQLTLEVSSGDITKETSDVIINSSNQTFNLNAGVSKAILDSAGSTVLLECSQIVNSPGYQPCPMILTSAGQLPCRNIIHIVGVNDPARIKEMVYEVLKVCEENKFSSVSFPALGTGQGGANPSAVADAMVGAVVDFVRKKHQRFVHSVKILIFQTAMIAEFHKSMKKREGEEVEEKSVLTKIKDRFTSLFSGFTEEQPRAEGLVLESEEFEPTVFQLCADDNKAVTLAKKRINELIVAEQAERTIQDMYIGHLSQADISELNALQKKLTVSIRLDRGQEEQEPKIHLEGLTRDVFTAESAVRDIIRRVERAENQKSKALLVSGLVEWQFLDTNTGKMEPFDIYTNLKLEEALEKKQNLEVKINNEKFTADPMLKSARSLKKGKRVELFRKDLKDDATLPSHWDDMKGDIEMLFPVAQGSQEYSDVETEFTKTGLTANIISIERVQNTTLWQSYQLMKKQMEVKNKHTNNERLLFHGTCSTAIDLINKQGFNRSYAGTRVGAKFGNGSYFAVDPVYSAQGYAAPDANRHKRMYQARVLVGDFTKGRPGLISPPSKSSTSAADLYDSVSDNPTNPTMFVIFSDIQAYPEYLITFT